MRSVNKILLLGNLGRDAETTFTPSGISATKFSVATTRRWKDTQTDEWKEETNWTNVVLWRQEKLANYLQKGKQVYVEGRLQTRNYEKDGKKVYVTEVIADEVILLGGAGEGAGEGNSRAARPQAAAKPAAVGKASTADPFEGMGVSDEDVPFN